VDGVSDWGRRYECVNFVGTCSIDMAAHAAETARHGMGNGTRHAPNFTLLLLVTRRGNGLTTDRVSPGVSYSSGTPGTCLKIQSWRTRFLLSGMANDL